MRIKTFFSIFAVIFTISCNSDDSEQFEIINEVNIDKNLKQYTNAICQFDLAKDIIKKPNVVLNCIMDLNGETVQIPSHVTFQYDGGQIINGTLVFSTGATIDGRLISPSLKLEGNPTLKHKVFELVSPSRWGIVEGHTNNATAQKNKEILQSIIDLTKKANGSVLKINKLDAYFKVGGINITAEQHSEISIHLPSNFTLEMTDNTYIRAQPTHFPYYYLMSTFDVDNVTIKGGHLIGDRYEHDYSDIIDIDGISRKTHEWPAPLFTAGSRNILFENIHISKSTGDGIYVGAANHRTFSTTPWNTKIVIKGCTITDSRRNGISVTDGEDITIQDCIIEHTGEGIPLQNNNGNRVYSSAGVPPRFGIDIEPVVKYKTFSRDSEIRFEWVENVKIINNRLTNNKAGSIIVYKADKVLVDHNFSDAVIALNDASNSTISYNVVEARSDENSTGISSGDARFYTDYRGGSLQQYAVNNDIIGNTIRGFSKGIIVRGTGGEVYNNKVYDYSFIGLQVDKVENTNIHHNEYKSNVIHSQGMFLSSYANNVKIYNETFTVNASYLYGYGFNTYNNNMKDNRVRNSISNFKIDIYNNTFNARKKATTTNSSGVRLQNNIVNLRN